ncbi:3-hydroxyacyl-ACP dehydratase FabZ [Anoxynatronum buryatiense]|uniref:3-hydroxyacyl-[acyl-carrier-protein] dehydratase FabZ n=1 Tax=Anoxynatronum buryatiense TaxID=489973 RepID=A0AA45WXY5_9CLOT|nr:3-hydroxyacyl-ACP dehydratase FabZ [Anoxynatronum buryatiense]SMP66527.1 3-hydroxyacyl-[acyl-carrier-protein] dehydratase [Anoxynatronum buryatiense]
MKMNVMEIMACIPHRYPFLLIDGVEIEEAGKRAVGFKNVTINEPFFQGHFPQEPVMPGVLILEALAQVGAVLLLNEPDYKGKTAYFAGVDQARFRRKVVPGDVLRLEIEITKLRRSFGAGKGVATVNGEKAAEAEILFAIS